MNSTIITIGAVIAGVAIAFFEFQYMKKKKRQ